MDSFEYDNWEAGANNLAPAGRLPEKSVRQAVNVDPTPGGELHLRSGYEKVYSGTNVRGILTLGHKMLIADGADLVEYDTLAGTHRVLRQIAGAGQFVGDVYADRLYFFTANEALEYDGTDVRIWGVPDVLSQPIPTVGAGSLPAGIYRLAVTFADADGREGGTDAPIIVTVPEGSSLSVALPTPPEGGTVRLYSSVANGETLYLQQRLSAAATVALNAVRDNTEILHTAYMHAPVVGSLVVAHNGQIAYADGRVVWLTVPMRPHLVDRRRWYFQYPDPVTNLLSDGDLFVSSDMIYAIDAAESDEPSQRVLLRFPAIPGTSVRLPDGRGAWMTRYGQAVTAKDPRGTSFMELVTRERYAPATMSAGVAGVVEHNGNQNIITSTRGPQGANPLAASDFFIGEVVRP